MSEYDKQKDIEAEGQRAAVYHGSEPVSVVCRGSWELGTACGRCARCERTRPKPQVNLVPWGYADGSYTCNCGDCGGQFIGDKRATKCKSCAMQFREKQLSTLGKPMPAAVDWRAKEASVIALQVQESLATLTAVCHQSSLSNGWWHCPHTGEDLLSNKTYAPYVIATKIALMHSELSEALEGDRKDQMDDKLPHYTMLTVELADTVIRVLDLAGRLNLPVAAAIMEKVGYNDARPDHKVVNRRKPGGKKY